MSRRLRWALAVGVALVTGHTVLTRSGSDFGHYRVAGARFLEAQPLYPNSTGLEFMYSPAAAGLFAPLALLPERAALGLFTLLTVLSMLRVAALARARAGAPGRAHLVLLLVAPYLLQALSYGQAEVLVLWLMVESEQRSQQQPVRSGALWALACLVKLPFLVFLLPAFAFRQWRRLAALAAATAVLLGLALARYASVSPLVEWFAHQRATAPAGLCSPSNQSVFALTCAGLTTPDSAGYLPAVGVASAALTGLYAAAAWRHRGSRWLVTCLGLHLVAFLSPLGWWTNLVGLTPLLYLLAATLAGAATRTARTLAGLALGVAAAAATVNHHLLGAARVAPFLPWHFYGLAGLWVGASAAVLALLEPGAVKKRPPTLVSASTGD